MPRLLRFRALTLVTFLLLTIHLMTAVSTQATDSAKTTDSTQAVDLKTMLLRAPIHDPVVFQQAHKYIQEMQSSTPCQQLATSTLIDGCQSLSVMGISTARLAGKTLEETKKEYATRLAVCELRSIEGGVPDKCIPFRPTACGNSHSWFSRRAHLSEGNICYPDHTLEQLANCYSALYKTQQMWTSLSNALNNAHIICKASRSAVENDEHLAMLKESVKAQHGISEVLSMLLQDTTSRLEEQHKFAEIIRQFQADIIASHETALAKADGVLIRLMSTLETKIDALLGNVVENTDNLFEETRASLKSLHDDAAEHYQAQVESQERSLRTHRELVDAVDNSLVDMRDIHMANIIKHALEAYNLMAQSMLGSQQLLESQLAINMYQNRTLEAFEGLNKDLANQRILIDENSGKISAMSIITMKEILRALTPFFSWLGWGFAVIIAGSQSRQLAVYMAFGGVVPAYLGGWLLDLLQVSPSLADYPQLQQAVWICSFITLTVGALVVIGMLSYRFLVLPAREHRNDYEKSKVGKTLE